MNIAHWLKLLTGILVCIFIAPVEWSAGDVISITMQSFILFIVAGYFGPIWGGALILGYLLLGALGLPIFANFESGFEKLTGPTAGFLWGFLIVGIYLGWRCERGHEKLRNYIFYFLEAHIILLILGFTFLYFRIESLNTPAELITLLPGLLIKSFAGGLIAFYLNKHFPFKSKSEPDPTI